MTNPTELNQYSEYYNCENCGNPFLRYKIRKKKYCCAECGFMAQRRNGFKKA